MMPHFTKVGRQSIIGAVGHHENRVLEMEWNITVAECANAFGSNWRRLEGENSASRRRTKWIDSEISMAGN